MDRFLFAVSSLVLLAALLGKAAVEGTAAGATSAPKVKTGERILEAAGELLASLDEKSREKALADPMGEERHNWHFIPRDRKGVPMKDLGEGQRAKVLALLRSSLSEEGARKAEEVMAHEEILRQVGGGGSFVRDPLLYYLTFFGKPSREGRWGWRLEGHHLSLNFALSGAEVISFTPAFYGANPAEVREGPRKGFRLLSGVEDIARELVTSLGKEEQAACLTDAEGDVPKEVPGAGTPRYAGPFPRGVSGERLKEDQRRMLRALIREYTRNFPEDLAGEIPPEDLKDIHFAWRGGLKPFEPHSYLIHGAGFAINYSNIQNGANHVHSSFRRLKGEFGLPEGAKTGG